MESYFLVFTAIAITTTIFLRVPNNWILYALAGTTSLAGLHVHIVATFYLSRIVLIAFLISLLLKFFQGRFKIRLSNLPSSYLLIFTLIIIFQIISTVLSSRTSDGFRQILIYLALMTMFIVVVSNCNNFEVIFKAIKIYIFTGLIQGVYGIYQVYGGRHNWLTYQNILKSFNIPTSNDHTNGGYIYSAIYDTFRAIGFYPADMSHYAGYMVGIVILAIAILAINGRSIWPKVIITVSIAAIILSLSRSGIITLVLIGIPCIFFILWRIQSIDIVSLGKSLIAPAILGVVLSYVAFTSAKLNLEFVRQTISSTVTGSTVTGSAATKTPSIVNSKTASFNQVFLNRFTDLVNSSGSQNESFNEHIETKLAGLAAFESSPLLGVGLGVNANPWVSETYKRGWGGSHSHHLDILGQTGLIGAFLQFLLMFMIGKKMWRGLVSNIENSNARYLLAGLLATYISALLGNFLYHYFTLDCLWFLMGCGVGISNLLVSNAENHN